MVQTRRQYNNWVEERGPNYQTSQSTQDSEECEACSQASSERSQYDAFDHNNDFHEPDNGPGPGIRYRPNDRCKRHRLPDDEEKDVEVIAYRRRKPLD